ncbi:MAG: hypothetical protein ACLP1Y_06940 [Candidatus Acidiferrales bacterium]
MKIHLKRCCIAICLTSVAAAGLSATTLEQMDLAQLAQAAEVVARVRCTGSVSQRDSGHIWTLTRFAVVEPIKGSPGKTLIVRLPGGRDGHISESVEGVPRFSPGEETILFLERTRAGDWSVSAWGEGTFRIERDARTRRESVTQDSSRLLLFNRATRTFRAQGIARMPMPDFRAKLAAALTE